jgi:hypothetical protein
MQLKQYLEYYSTEDILVVQSEDLRNKRKETLGDFSVYWRKPVL